MSARHWHERRAGLLVLLVRGFLQAAYVAASADTASSTPATTYRDALQGWTPESGPHGRHLLAEHSSRAQKCCNLVSTLDAQFLNDGWCGGEGKVIKCCPPEQRCYVKNRERWVCRPPGNRRGLPEAAVQKCRAGTTLDCVKTGFTGAYGPCGGENYPVKCCPDGQKCYIRSQTAWFCSEPKDAEARGLTAALTYIVPSSDQLTPSSPLRIGSEKIGRPVGDVFRGFSTYYERVGTPFSGCGVPPSKLVDDNGKRLPFVALNLLKDSRSLAPTYPIEEKFQGRFNYGNNCGRWIKITLKRNCPSGGYHDPYDYRICVLDNGNGEQNYRSDGQSDRIIYGYVADSCPDYNYWCREDINHLDINGDYLENQGLLKDNFWNGREVSWQFMNGPPRFGWKMDNGLQFMWKDASKWEDDGRGFFAALIIHGAVTNGIGEVQQNMGGDLWVQCYPLIWLGQMYVLNTPHNYRTFTRRTIKIRVRDLGGKLYGTYTLDMGVCNSGGQCPETIPAPILSRS